MIIRNRDQLLSHGNIAGRRVVLDILEAGMAAADPYQNTRDLIRIEDGKLIVGNDRIPRQDTPELQPPEGAYVYPPDPLVFDLSEVKHIYVAGGGKAAQRMAKAMENVLGDLITEGHINAKKGDEVYLERIEVTLAGHPIPDEDSVAGARRILEIEQKAGRGDIVFLSESGGGSALMALPAPGITLHDLQQVYRILYFGCGAPMPVANAVRNLLTIVRLKHARHVGDEATLIQVCTPEEPPRLRTHLNKPPSDADPYEHAIGILKHYGRWGTVPESVRAFLLRADPAYAPLRPDEWFGKPRHYFRVMGPEVMLDGALHRAAEMGLPATVLATSLNDIDAQAAGEILAHIAQEIEALDRPLPAPCVLLCGGELVVATGDEPGIGGRNQEFILSTVARIAGSPRIVVASADSDGSDGPTDAAGGIVDGDTAGRAAALGIDIAEALRRHDSHAALEALGDTIETGVLNTNVRDLRVIYVAGRDGGVPGSVAPSAVEGP
jgi:glycerate 2-kinase